MASLRDDLGVHQSGKVRDKAGWLAGVCVLLESTVTASSYPPHPRPNLG